MADLKMIENVTLPDHSGVEHRIGDLWAERPAVIAWLRHYG